MPRKSIASRAEEEADYEYQKYLEKKRQLQQEMMSLEKFNIAYQPSNMEFMESYVQRLDAVAHQLTLELQIHYNWYTHKRSPNCPICDSMNLCDYLIHVLRNISTQEPKKWQSIIDLKGNSGKLDWKFKKTTK